MASSQDKTRVLVLCQGKGRGAIAIQGVAVFAMVEIWRLGELSLVLILVTIETLGKLDLVQRVLSFGDMTLRTLQGRVLAFQGIRRGGMFRDAKLCGLKSIDRMAGRTLPSVGALHELSPVLVGVTVHAFLKCQGLLKVASFVAGDALY